MSIFSKSSILKILICQQHQLGDVLLATPCIRLLKNQFPAAELHFLTEKKCVPVLENNPLLTKIWAIDKGCGLFATNVFYRSLRRERFDLFIDFQQLVRLKLAALYSGAPLRLSYKPKWYNRLFYNMQGEPEEGYASKAKSGVLAPLGVFWKGEAPELHLLEEEKRWAQKLLCDLQIPKESFLLTIDSTHRRITRKWPEEYYAQLIKKILRHHKNVYILMLHGPGERSAVETIMKLAGDPKRCVLPKEQTTLRQLASLIDQADGHFGNCSSPRHIAVARGTRSLVVHGSNKPGGWTFPSSSHQYIWNEEIACLGCNRSECPLGTLECLYSLTPDYIYERIKAFFF